MLIGANAAIRRSVLRDVGPFTQQYQWAEDREMYGRLLRAGVPGYYLPGWWCTTTCRRSG